MDAYSSYIISISNARTSELRREAAEYALSAAARRRRRAHHPGPGAARAHWAGALQRLLRRRVAAPAPVPRDFPQALARSSAPSSR